MGKSLVASEPPLLEAQLKAALNLIPAHTWYAAPSGALIFLNERGSDYLGLPQDHPLRFGIETGAAWDSHISLLHPDDHEESRRAWSTCLNKGSAGEFSFRVRNAEGKYRWFLSRAEPVRASDGTLLYWVGVNLDIDDAKRAEDALRKSEKELRDVIDTIPALVWSTLPDGSNTFVNKRFVEYTGSSAEETAGSGWQALIHPDDLERHAAKWMEAVATGKPHESEVRSRRSDGQYRWHLDRGIPLRDEDGNIVKWYGVTTDIEDRKRAEDALQLISHDLRDSKAKLEEAERITHVGYWEWDLATDCLIWSDETYRIFGLRPQERPMNVDALREMIHPQDRDRVFRDKEQTIASGVCYDVEHRIVRPGGEVRALNSTCAVKNDESGRPTLFYGTVQDITDRKRAQEELQKNEFYLAEGQRVAHMGSWALDAAGGFNYWSSELFQIHGLDPSGKPPTVEEYLALVHPEDRAFMKQGFAKMLDDHLAFDFTKRIVQPKGEIRHVRCVGVPVTQGGTFQGFLGTGMDVTELKRAEQELQQLVDLVPQMSAVLGPDGKCIHANRMAREYTGLTLEEFRSLDVIRRTTHPDDVERAKIVRERGLAGNEPFEFDARALGKDGTYRWFLWRYNPLVEEGRVRRWYVSATEIESRKQEEERVRQENVRLEERTRIARELHDTLLQTVQSASMQLSVAVDGVASDSLVKPQLDRILQIMSLGIDEGRRAIQGLRSSGTQTLDLVAVLSHIQDELEVQPDIAFRVMVTGRQKQVPVQIHNEIYRIGREALLNAFRHSGAKSVELELEYTENDLRMCIRDNGRGIDPQTLDAGREGHWGLEGMRERATRISGLLKISSSAAGGTEVQLSVPAALAFQVSALMRSA